MNSFIPKSIAALTGFAMILGLALPVSAVELVVVSWGGRDRHPRNNNPEEGGARRSSET